MSASLECRKSGPAGQLSEIVPVPEYIRRVEDILNDLQNWRDDNDLALAVFTTPDCGVCNALKPKIAELAELHPRLTVRYIDLEAHPEAGGQYGVFVVPVLLLFVQGRETLRLARYFGMHELEEPVARYASLLEDA